MKNQIPYIKISFLMLSLLFLNACNNKTEKKLESKIVSDSVKNIVVPEKKVVTNNSDNLLGIWNADENPIFEIKQDSIYYIDEDRSYSYKLKDSVINIYYDDFIYKGVISLKNKNKLMIKDSINTSFYTK